MHKIRSIPSKIPYLINFIPNRINRLEPFHLAFGITPLYDCIPAHISDRVIIATTRTDIRQIRVTIRHRPIAHGLPLAPSHFILTDLESLH